MNYAETINIGDLLTRLKFPGVVHVGVVVGVNLVCHNTPERGEHISTLSEFAAGQTNVGVRRTNADPSSVISRANQLLANPKRYDPVNRNCEHTAFEIVYGAAKSRAVLTFVCLFLVGAVLLLLLRQR